MLTVAEARKIGIKACIEKLGYDFCKKHADNSTTAYGEDDGFVFCYVGVDDSPAPDYSIKDYVWALTEENKFPYSASCNVSMEDGKVMFLECELPNLKEEESMEYDKNNMIGFGFGDEEGNYYNLYLGGSTVPYERLDPETLHMTELFYFDEEEMAAAYLYETQKHHPGFREILDTFSVVPLPQSFVESGLFDPILKFDW